MKRKLQIFGALIYSCHSNRLVSGFSYTWIFDKMSLLDLPSIISFFLRRDSLAAFLFCSSLFSRALDIGGRLSCLLSLSSETERTPARPPASSVFTFLALLTPSGSSEAWRFNASICELSKPVRFYFPFQPQCLRSHCEIKSSTHITCRHLLVTFGVLGRHKEK